MKDLLLTFAVAFSIFLLAAPALAAVNSDTAPCAQICGGLRGKLKANTKSVDEEYKLWERRLNTKGEIVRYSRGYSAAEELLEYMASYDARSGREQIYGALLTFLMAKCFPETYVDAQQARLSGLVDTVWVARNVKIEHEIFSCR